MITPDVPLRVIVAVNVPRARASLPLGLGRSSAARSVVLALATIETWSRISPAGFVGVCTLTYARSFWIASRTVASTGAVPVAPLVHGAQSGIRTGPATPRAATCTCAAMALPVRLLNSSRQDMSAPVAVFVSVAVNVPRAPLTSPFGDGVSLAAVMFAAIRIVVAWLRAAAPSTAASVNASTSAPASK